MPCLYDPRHYLSESIQLWRVLRLVAKPIGTNAQIPVTLASIVCLINFSDIIICTMQARRALWLCIYFVDGDV